MPGKIKSISNPRFTTKVLTQAQIERIHEATLDILEDVGVRFPSEKALRLWDVAGACVNYQTQIVKAPRHLIERALDRAPDSYTLAARDASQDLLVDGNHVFVGTDGCGVEVIDLHTGQRHRSTLQDVADIARAADAMEEVGFHWVPVSAQDKPVETRSLHELKAIWENSTKHVQTESIYSEREARAAVEMAAAVAGGTAALKRRPVLSIMQCTFPPLGQDGGSIDAALVAAETGLPVGFMTMTSCASTGPATVAGTLAVGNAEVISALALWTLLGALVLRRRADGDEPRSARIRAANGGFPVRRGDEPTGRLLQRAAVDGLSRRGPKEPNWQAGVENSLSTFMAVVMAICWVGGAAGRHGDLSFEQMMLIEIYSIGTRCWAGLRYRMKRWRWT
jgi:trimethylamine--corrinoid protein Co-methyltransferase